MADVSTAPGPAQGGPDPAGARTPLPPLRQGGPGMRPALVVLGLAVLIVVLFGVGSALWGSGTTAGPRRPAATKVPGTSLVAVPAALLLGPIVQPGSPPANIVDALTVPRGTRAGVSVDHSAGAGQYDQEMHLTLAASEEAVITFYRVELPALGWHITSTGPPTGQPGTELLAEQSGGDGWQWEVGVVISPTTFGGSPTGSTPFALRLIQVPDGN